MENFEIRNTLFSYISRVQHRGAIYIEELLREKGIDNLVYSHIRIIIILSVYKKLSMKEISNLISKDKSTVTSLVNKLERMGYVKKTASTEDKRVIYLTLEEKADEIIETVFQVTKVFHKRVEKILTKEEINQLFCLMEKLVENF
ncbi:MULTISPECIES: MarR family transcriptional regulator [unclassified Fusobacterium]|uniref:MarR family winged helix-turn-helix transcriptional regulator n=1 Tax=unclassified Fusobacterium TaxID=2648384 RepID=UPI0025BB2301|nr:MarR family transcriptional regulator [Fusobacterium sp.]